MPADAPVLAPEARRAEIIEILVRGYLRGPGRDYLKRLEKYPALLREGKNPLQIDSKPPSVPLRNYMYNETRFTILQNSDPETARELLRLAQHDAEARWKLYEALAAIQLPAKAKKAEKKMEEKKEAAPAPAKEEKKAPAKKPAAGY